MRFDPWGLHDTTAEPIEGGYNSHAWYVRAGDLRYVAKRVGGDRRSFEAGLHVAELLEERGFPAGGPVRTLNGDLTVSSEGEWLALLRYVPGEPVALGTPDGLATWGRVMGRVHSLLVDVSPPDALPRASEQVDTNAAHLAVAPWVASAIASATSEIKQMTGLTHGIIHGDACEPRFDEATGVLSVIDWGTAAYAPLVSDVGIASYHFQSSDLGRAEDFGPFLEAYLSEAPVRPAELEHVAPFVRLRAAMSGWYFAWRIHAGYTVGADDGWNREGLEQARRFWETLSG